MVSESKHPHVFDFLLCKYFCFKNKKNDARKLIYITIIKINANLIKHFETREIVKICGKTQYGVLKGILARSFQLSQ